MRYSGAISRHDRREGQFIIRIWNNCIYQASYFANNIRSAKAIMKKKVAEGNKRNEKIKGART